MPDLPHIITGDTPAARRRLSRVLSFGVVGTMGFAVDAGATLALTQLGLDPRGARAIAIVLALATTYILNRTMTFRVRGARGKAAVVSEGVRYLIVAGISAVCNWLVYAAALIAAPGLPLIAAVVIGSVTAMGVSYVGYSRFAFRPQ